MLPFHRLRKAIALPALFVSAALSASTTAYLKEMPSPAEVRAFVQGADPQEQQARQVGALLFMAYVIRDVLSEERSFDHSAEERAAMKRYTDAADAIERTVQNELGAGTEAYRNWWNIANDAQYDEAFRKQLLAHFLSPALHAHYDELQAERAKPAPEPAPAPDNPSVLWPQAAPALEMTPERQAGADLVENYLRARFLLPGAVPYVLLILCLALIGLGLARERMPSGLDPADPDKYRVGKRRFTLYSTTGVAQGTEAGVVTTFHSSTDGYGRTSTSTSQKELRSFHICERDGQERPFKLVNSGFAVRDGNTMSAMWAIEEGKQEGEVFLFHNHQTATSFWTKDGMAPLVRARRRVVLPIMLAALVLTIMVRAHFAAEHYVLHGGQAAPGMGRHALPDIGWSPLWVPLLAGVIGYLGFGSFTTLRARHLVNELAPKWISAFRAQAITDGWYAKAPDVRAVTNIGTGPAA